jgi:hypothetical protein
VTREKRISTPTLAHFLVTGFYTLLQARELAAHCWSEVECGSASYEPRLGAWTARLG